MQLELSLQDEIERARGILRSLKFGTLYIRDWGGSSWLATRRCHSGLCEWEGHFPVTSEQAHILTASLGVPAYSPTEWIAVRLDSCLAVRDDSRQLSLDVQ